MTALPWRDGAACAGTPIEWWYPVDRHGWNLDDHVPPNAALRCAACPVRRECHSHALRHEGHGVWAGTSEKDRKRLRRTARIRLTPLYIDAIAQTAEPTEATP